jgi:protein Hikeshi
MALQPLFGLVVPGRPLVCHFQQLDATKAITVLEQPAHVSEITFFLMPTTTIPPGYGAILYYATPPFTNWEILGSVDPAKPSGTFRTGWSTNDDVRNSPCVQLGVSLEP